MSQPKKYAAMLDTIDRLLESYNRISGKETGAVAVDDLKKDLIEFRDALTEFGAVVMRFAITVAQENPDAAKSVTDLLTNLTSKSVPQARVTVLNCLTLLEMSIMNNNASQQQLNTIATMTATGLVGDGIIDSLKMTREIVKRLF